MPPPAVLALQPGSGYRLPPQAYYSNDWFYREQRQLFRRTWNFVGETRDLVAPGDFLTADVGGAPIVVMRDQQGQLRAFHNLCRHRGAKLMDGSGNCEAMVCPYHRWRYALDGRLQSVPQQADQFPDLALEDWGLQPVALAQWQGLLFVNPDGAAPEFDGWLDGLPASLQGFAPDQMELLIEGTFEFAANWKFYIENHVDWYHLWYTHPQTLRMWDHHAGNMEQPGAHWVSFEPTRAEQPSLVPTLQPLSGLADQQRQNGAHLIFPNLTLFTGESYFATGLVTPLAADRARMHFRALVAPNQNLSSEVAEQFLSAFHQITEQEDAAMTARLQAAVQSDAFGVGPMCQTFEAPIARLHAEYLAVFEA